MVLEALQITGFSLGLLAMIGTLVATVLPYWETSVPVGVNIITVSSRIKGLWMDCVYKITGTFQCNTFNSVLGLSADLQTARVMMILSLILSALALIVSSIGMQCTVCLNGSTLKNKVAGVGGWLLIMAGVFSIIPVSQKIHQLVQTFYSSASSGLKYEMDVCLYLGLASALLSAIGGILLCLSFCLNSDKHKGYRCPGGCYLYPGCTGMGRIYRERDVNVMPYQTGMNHRPTANSNQSAAAYRNMKQSPIASVPNHSFTAYV